MTCPTRSLKLQSLGTPIKIFKGSLMAKCAAYARTTNEPCFAKALRNGRCRLHGGLSTGPKTSEGKAKISEATKQRMASGQKELAKAGFQRWLNNGGRKHLVECAERRKLMKRMKRSFDVWLSRKRQLTASANEG